jgi:hypothetical protein
VQAKRRIEIARAICTFNLASSKRAYDAYLRYQPTQNDTFYFPLALESKTATGGNTYVYVWSQSGPLTIRPGQQARVTIHYGGSGSGDPGAPRCSIYGDLVVLS